MFFVQRHRPWSLFPAGDDTLLSPWEEGREWAPAVDIREEADAYVLHADLPGVSLQDIQLTRENGTLTLSGERKDSKEEAKDGYHRLERRLGRFSRSFSLPEGTVGDIAAKYQDGVLEVRIPKRPEVVPERIAIQS